MKKLLISFFSLLIISVSAQTFEEQINESIDAWYLEINLPIGWSMFGYNCPEHIDLVEAVTPYIEDIIIVKDYHGAAFLPEFNFNGVGMLSPGEGYQIKVSDYVNSFRLCDWYVTNIPHEDINNIQDTISGLHNLITTIITENIKLDSLITQLDSNINYL